MEKAWLIFFIVFMAISFAQACYAELLSGCFRPSASNRRHKEARVVLRNSAGQYIATVSADSRGWFSLEGFRAGTYHITVYGTGQGTALKQAEIQVADGESTEINYNSAFYPRKPLWSKHYYIW